MGEGRPSWLFSIFVLVSDFLVIGLAVAAEINRSRAQVVPDRNDEYAYCVYDSDVATVYGEVACLLLALSHGLTMDITRLRWGGTSSLKSEISRAWQISLIIASWLAFIMGEGFLIWGTAKNANHTTQRGIYHVTNLSCEEVPKGVFVAGAGSVMLTMVLHGLNYLALLRVNEHEKSAFMVSLIPIGGDSIIVGIDSNQKI